MTNQTDTYTPTPAEVLRLVLDEHPAPITLREVALALRLDPDTFAGMDRVRVTVAELAADGLLHVRGDDVRATRAAARAAELLCD